MITKIDIHKFLELRESVQVVDVRSPKEFRHAHIPNAKNIALFTDKEREEVGICYKEKGKQAAILLGLSYVGIKLQFFSETALSMASGNRIILYCWRGGMRSASMAWLFSTVGIHVYLLEGGYKTYRQFAYAKFNERPNFVVLGGMTGSGKTRILEELQNMNKQVINLEKLANHKGSAFGMLGEKSQSSTEQFENNLFEIIKQFDFTKEIWIEDESRAIGSICIPDGVFKHIRNSFVVNIDIPMEKRAKFLMKEYGGFNPEDLKKSILKIQKRLGGKNTKLAIEAVNNNDLLYAIKIVLEYYDKAYLFGLSKRESYMLHTIKLNSVDTKNNTKKILELYNHHIKSKH